MGKNYALYDFQKNVEPAFCLTFDTDITNFLQHVRKQNFSFTLAFVYVVCKWAKEIEAFCYRFLNDSKIVLFDKIDIAFTYSDKDTELFEVVDVSYAGYDERIYRFGSTDSRRTK